MVFTARDRHVHCDWRTELTTRDADVLAVTAVIVTPIVSRTQVEIVFVTIAFDLVQPDWSTSFAKFRAAPR